MAAQFILPRAAGKGTALRSRVVEGARAATAVGARDFSEPPHAPSTALRVVPLPRTYVRGRMSEIVLAARLRARAMPTTKQTNDGRA